MKERYFFLLWSFIYSIASLEDENKVLKSEFCRLAQDTDELDAKEQRLLTDLTGQLCKRVRG